MSDIPLRRRGGPLLLNRSHGLCVGLRGAWVPNLDVRAINLAGGGQHPGGNKGGSFGSVPNVPSAYGPAWNLTSPQSASTTVLMLASSSGGIDMPWFRVALPFSWFVLCKPTANGDVVTMGNRSSSIYRGNWLQVGPTIAGIGFGDAGGATGANRHSKDASGLTSISDWCAFSGSCRSGTDMSVYRNGVDVGGSATGTGGAINYQNSSGTVSATSGTFTGQAALILYWSRSLGAADHAALARDPWQVFHKPAAFGALNPATMGEFIAQIVEYVA